MHASDLCEVLCAAHLGATVEGPFSDRGGIMLVGPPAVLKTTFVSVLDKNYPDALMLSDINVQSLIRMRDAIAAGKVNTLVLPELQKVYERAEVTSQNVEGTLRAIVAEGFSAASFEDSRINRLSARALVVAALQPSVVEKHFSAWEESGFNRRFLWPLVRLKDPGALERAAVAWQKIDFRIRHVPLPPALGDPIPNLTTVRERQRLAALVKHQPGGDHSIQIQLMTRILAVLRWWYQEAGEKRDAMDTVERFAVALGKQGAELELRRPRGHADPQEAQAVHNAGAVLAGRRWEAKRKAKAKARHTQRRRKS
jgi:hypothetical protein